MSTLYIVATPIGNLEDFSSRAVDTLQKVDRIGCEDTRTSSILLNHYGIEKSLFPFHQHNEHKQVERLAEMLNKGLDIALITDAGMPGISDPGFLATRRAHQAGHKVSVIPGPDACTTALAASGLPSDRYLFEGFLPPKKGRKSRFEEIADREVTTVLYESPYRLIKALGQLRDAAGENRLICIARELTKKHEEIQRGAVGKLLTSWEERTSIKGEFVIVISGKTYSE